MTGLSHPSAAVLALPAELSIYTVGELHPQWLAWVATLGDAAGADGDGATVDAGAVDQVDAAGLQLLLSLERSVGARGRLLQFSNPSAALRQGCQALGLADWLRIRSPEGAPA